MSCFYDQIMLYHILYNKLSYARVLIGSHLWSIGGQSIDDVIIKPFFSWNLIN